MTRRYGTQPGYRLLREEGWTAAALARATGEDYPHVVRALLGIIRPSQLLRDKLPQVTGHRVEDLFTADALAAPRRERRSPHPRVAAR